MYSSIRLLTLLEITVSAVGCKHVVEVDNEFIFQRYCHVYREGELENLCSTVPGCRIIGSRYLPSIPPT